jgi:exonuclease SbcD
MLLFHLSDLHLGKTFHGYELLEDQAFMLDAIVSKIEDMRPSVLLIAGDIYDRAIPPVSAIECFDGFLRAARKASPKLKVILIPGNHDSAGRLSFGSSLFADSGLFVVAKLPSEPVIVRDDSGKAVAIWALPFLTQTSGVGDAERVENEPKGVGAGNLQQSLMKRAIDAIDSVDGVDAVDSVDGIGSEEEARPWVGRAGLARVLVAHCFTAGAFAGDSELSFVGMAEQVDTALFEGFDYVALGHLHSVQSPAPRIWYSGSPMAYSMREVRQDKGFLAIDVEAGAVPKVDFIPIKPKRGMRKISGFFSDLVANPLPEDDRKDYIEAYVVDENPVPNAGERLKAIYPYLVGVPQRAYEIRQNALGGMGEGHFSAGSMEASPALDLAHALDRDFCAFYREMMRDEPPEDMVSLFDSMAKEVFSATDQA